MSITPEVLSQEHLFAFKSPRAHVNAEEFLRQINSDSSELLQFTYNLLKESTSVAQSLKLWEIRFTLLLIENKSNYAKSEAIALNNALYLAENDNVAPVLPPSKTANTTPVYALPKNNHGLIGHELLVLILRLKSAPNLSLINEFYKLCYQLRLRSNPENVGRLAVHLMNLSLDTMVVLVVNKNYATVLSLLNCMKKELSPVTELYKQFYDMITLTSLLVKTAMYEANQTAAHIATKLVSQEYSDDYESLKAFAIPSLAYVLQTVSPNFAAEEPDVLDIKPNDITIDKLVSLVYKGRLSSRIFCCLFGLWDLINTFQFQLYDDNGKMSLEPNKSHSESAESYIASCYTAVSHRWCQNIHKVYGLE